MIIRSLAEHEELILHDRSSKPSPRNQARSLFLSLFLSLSYQAWRRLREALNKVLWRETRLHGSYRHSLRLRHGMLRVPASVTKMLGRATNGGGRRVSTRTYAHACAEV